MGNQICDVEKCFHFCSLVLFLIMGIAGQVLIVSPETFLLCSVCSLNIQMNAKLVNEGKNNKNTAITINWIETYNMTFVS